MTKLFSTLALMLALTFTLGAQDTPTMYPFTDRSSEPTEEEMQRLVKNKVFINHRAAAIDFLSLSEKEIQDFDPLFKEYISYANKLQARRADLIAEFRDEMSEDNSPKSIENETADFIEDFWEVDIKQMELKKDYFDKLEDRIGSRKALQLFAYEDMLMNRARRKLVMDMLPDMPSVLMLVPTGSVSYQSEIDDYRNWTKVNIDGKVSLGHEFTRTGLEKLLNAAEAMTKAEGITVANFAGKKKMIMDDAAKLQKNWRSLTHADLAKDAFQATTDIFAEITKDSRFSGFDQHISSLRKQANSINDDVKLTDQANKVYGFFDTAEKIVNRLVAQANGNAR